MLVNFCTLNVRGLKSLQKRRAFFLSLEFVSFDVLFLQECHLKDKVDVEIFQEDRKRGNFSWGGGEY